MSDLSCCELNNFMAALADETRQRILVLLRGREMSVNELSEHFVLTQPTISHHLAILRRVNLVIPRRDGQFTFYRLNSDCVAECYRDALDRFKILGRDAKK